MSSGATQARVLAFNSGSSSLKFGLYLAGPLDASALLEGEAEAIGKPGKVVVKDPAGQVLSSENADFRDADGAVRYIKALLERREQTRPQIIGHRLVHGGPDLLHHALIDAPVLAQLRGATPFAPLHMPAALAVIDSALAHYPNLPQAACFDTAFHADLPDTARCLPLPRQFRAEGLRRYGFHGLSCASILARLDPVPPRLIIAHLGSGASVTAVKDGRSVDTSMGLSPDGGVIMATRSGDLDPGALFWLARRQHLDYDALEALVNRKAGLLGISGLSGDMRQLRQAAPHNADAALAVRMFCISVAKTIAGMSVSLGGLDRLVFTGGIGEHDAATRNDITSLLGHLIDDTDGSGSRVAVMATEEGKQIARQSFDLADAG